MINSDTSMFDLTNKTIVVTGGGGLLGSAYCDAFAKAGATVVVADLNEKNPGDISEKLKAQYGARSIGLSCDVSNESEVKSLFENVMRELGSVDVVLNNAAATGEHLMKIGNVFSDFENYPLELWNQVIETNLTGVFLVAREGGKVMKQSGGSLINVSSIYGLVGPDHRIYKDMNFSSFPAYSASKAGVHGLTQWLATYWGSRGIRVNTVFPGGVFNSQHSEFVKRYSDRTPLGRMANKEDMIGIMIYLASDASKYCTGQRFVVDGGLTAW